MGLTLVGLLGLSAKSFTFILVAAGTVGLGSAIFHPEASRVAHMAAGIRRGFAQSLFQLGGNAGSSLGPLAAAAIVSRGLGENIRRVFAARPGRRRGAVGMTGVQGTYHRITHKTHAGPRSQAVLSRGKNSRSRSVY